MAKKSKKERTEEGFQVIESSIEIVTQSDATEETPPSFDHENPPEATLAAPTLESWFAAKAEWIKTEALDAYHVVRAFCADFKLIPVLKSEMSRLSPSKDPKEICRILLSQKK